MNLTLTNPRRFLDLINNTGLSNVSDLYICQIASGESGPMAVLNLRKVCQDTKQLVDYSLSPSVSKRVFSEIVAKVNLTPTCEPNEVMNHRLFHDHDSAIRRNVLCDFKRGPPPPGVTSLQIDGADSLLLHEDEDQELKQFFVSYWSPKLDYLHVDGYFDGLEELFPSAPLKVLCIDYLKKWPRSNNNTTELYDLPIEELSIRSGVAGRLAGRVNSFKNLKRFYFSGYDFPDNLRDDKDSNRNSWIFHLIMLIYETKYDANFQLIGNPAGIRIADNEESRYLINSIGNTTASFIRFETDDSSLRQLVTLTSKEEARKFCKTIEDISCYNKQLDVENVRDLLPRKFFPLIRLREGFDINRFEGLKFLDALILPRDLKYLRTSCSFLPHHLPYALKFLHLSNQLWTPSEWQLSLIAIGQSCFCLEELKISIKFEAPLKLEDCRVPQREPSFKSKR